MRTAGEKVAHAALDSLLEYHEKLELAALLFTSSGLSARHWLERRDEATRAAAIVLTRRGWPLGEALLEAHRDEEVEWTITPDKRKAVGQGAGGDGAAAATPEKSKKPRTGETTSAGKALCKPHNDNRGCTRTEGACPTKRAHACDVLKSDGKTVCGSTSHIRKDCPHAGHWTTGT